MHAITRRAPLALSGLLFCALFLLAPHAYAQFASPTLDGVINAGEYGVHTDGQNQQTNGSQVWYMTWDDTNLYVALANANPAEAAVLYIDKDPALPATSGGSGNLNGQPYDGTSFSSLPFRADFVAYFKAGYREFRVGSGWGTAFVGAGGYAQSGNTRELSIPWSIITGGAGRPAAFNFFAYATSVGGFVYAQVPGGNPGGGIGLGAVYPRYYSVLSTVDAASTKPFSRDTIDRTVGSSGATYTTLKLAFDAINGGSGGLTGTVNLYVIANTTEPAASPTLNASGSGSANYASVTIRPSGGSWTISMNLFAGGVILDGADNVTIDGRLGGTGATRSLTIENLASGNARAVGFVNDATYNTVRYTTLKAGPTGGPFGVVTFSGTTGVTGNDDNTIEYNDIGPAASGVLRTGLYAQGTAGKENSNIRIANNDFHDFWADTSLSHGMVFEVGNTDWTISDNSFYQTTARSGVAGSIHVGIYLVQNAGVFTVSGNYIGGSAPLAGGSPQPMTVGQFTGIYLQASPTLASSIQGNTITNLALTGATSGITWRGIYTLSAADVGTVMGNTVGSGTAADAVVVTSPNSNTSAIGIIAGGGATCNIQNNVIGGITTNVTTAGLSADNTGISTVTCAPTLTNNTVVNLVNNATGTSSDLIGISATYGAASTYTGNTVRNLTTASQGTGCGATAPVVGMFFGVGADFNISGNMIHSLAATEPTTSSCVTGLSIAAANTGAQTVSNNFVHSLRSASTLTAQTPAALVGVILGTTSTSMVLANNRVRLGIDAAGNSITQGYGIAGLYTSTTTRGGFYHNTVYIGGTGVDGTTNVGTAALRHQSTTGTSLFNNLWVNARANATGAAIHAAAHFDNTAMTANYNLYHAPASGLLVRFGANTYATVAAWNAASGDDLNSLSGDPHLVNPTGDATTVDLHINAASANISPAEGGGLAGFGVPTDYEGDARSASAPDIGADEFTPTGTQLNTTYNSITVPTAQTFTLAANTAINRSLTLNGLLNVGASTLTFGPNATVGGGPFSATNMIIADGGGQVCKRFAGVGAFTYPIGDNTGVPEYSPATLNFTAGTFAAGAQACARVTNAAHPAVDAANFPAYLTRYWTVTQTGITGFTANTSFVYTDADLVLGGGQTESALALWKYDAPNWTLLNPTNVANNTLSGAVTSFSDFTARSVSPLAVALADFHGAVIDGQPVLTWQTVSETDHAGFNVYRSESEQGPWAKVNAALIASAAPGSAEGHAYTWTDTDAAPGAAHWYMLEDVALSGATTQHGPVRVGPDAPTAVNVRTFTAQLDWPALIRSLLGLK